jgi:hypothetical protein
MQLLHSKCFDFAYSVLYCFLLISINDLLLPQMLYKLEW